MTLVEDGVQDEVPLSKSPPETTCAGVQAAASGAPAGAAAAGVTGSERAATAATANTPAARALWGVDLTRNSFYGGRDSGLLGAARPDWVCRWAALGCA